MDLSIIIPTLNRVTSLQSTLRSIIAQQETRYEYEVIVVDNGSSDTTQQCCEEAKGGIKNFVYHYDAEPGMLTGRHKGAELASGKILSFIDDDVELNPGWINAVAGTFDRYPHVAIVSGPSLAKYQVYPPFWLRYFWQPTPYGGKMCLPLSLIDTGADEKAIDPVYAFGLNYSIRKDIFTELGGFHPDRITDNLQQYQGDGETGLSMKAKMKDYTALYVSSALLYHLVPEERLQVAYFERWHFYSGVCNSFTHIRSQHNLYPFSDNQIRKPHKLSPVLLSKLASTIRRIRNRAHAVPEEIKAMQFRFDNKFREGYDFHQQSFQKDEKVKTWVLRSDYWNYKLPP